MSKFDDFLGRAKKILFKTIKETFVILCILVGIALGLLLSDCISKYKIDKLEKEVSSLTKSLDDKEIVYGDNATTQKEIIDELSASLDWVTKDVGSVYIDYNFTEEEFDLLCRCVQAEAGPKNFESQKMVACVIMNRVASNKFPDSVEDVIMQNNGTVYQFEVVENGMIDTEATDEVKQSVARQVLFNETSVPKNILYFHATEIDYKVNRTVWKRVEGTSFAY